MMSLGRLHINRIISLFILIMLALPQLGYGTTARADNMVTDICEGMHNYKDLVLGDTSRPNNCSMKILVYKYVLLECFNKTSVYNSALMYFSAIGATLPLVASTNISLDNQHSIVYDYCSPSQMHEKLVVAIIACLLSCVYA